MHVRPAELKDIPQLVNLGKQLFDLHLEFDSAYYQIEDNFSEHFDEWIKNQIANPSSLLLIAENETDQSIAGFISGFMKSLYPWFKTKTVGHISYLIIDPKFRKLGVGKMLMTAAENWFKQKNITYIEVYVEEKNSIGQYVWFSYGFVSFKKFLQKKI